MTLTRNALLLCGLMLLVVPLSAQPPFDSMDPMKMEGNFENLRLLKLIDAVDLTEAQSDKFMPLFRSFRNDMRDLRQERREIIDHLRELIKDSASGEQLKGAMTDLRTNQKHADSRMQKFLDDCATVLTVQQTARLVVFQEDFEREVLESLREFRHRNNPRPDGKI